MEALQSTIRYDSTTGVSSLEEKNIELHSEAVSGRQVEENVVGIYPNYLFQTVEGFGCALTESACYLLSQMEPEKRQGAIRCWFGEDGVNARFARIHIDSCDYSLSEYQAVEDPIADPELNTFSIRRDHQYILPVMREILEITGKELSILLSPWSPPAQWKTPPELNQNDTAVYGGLAGNVDFSKPGRCFGGRLKPEYYKSWARYLVKYIQAYLEEGIPVTMLSVQNEASAATMWDSCLWSSEQEKSFLKNYLYPQIKEAGLSEKIGLFVWDHNKERMVEHIDEIMDEDITEMIEGFAYHWYSGDHFEALSILHRKYPDKVLMHSESCGLHIPGKVLAFDVPEEMKVNLPKEMRKVMEKKPLEVDFEDAVRYAHDMIGDLNHGMQRWIDWNLLVDRNGGPRHVAGGFAAPIVAEADGSFTKTISYAYIRQIARTVLPGAVRIGTSCYDSDLDVTAVINADHSIGILLLNRYKEEKQVAVRISGYLCMVSLPAQTLSSVQIEQSWLA